MPTSTPKKKSKGARQVPAAAAAPAEEEEVLSDMEAQLAGSDDEEEAVSSGAESAEEAEEESEDEDEDEDEDEEGETPEQKATKKKKREKDAATRRTVKAKRRGHRKIATMAGFSANHVSHHAARDVCEPILSLSETIKAAKWAPTLADKATFENIGEFKERTRLATESLPPGPAKVLQQCGETFLRRLVVGVVTRQSDMARTSPSAAMVAAETRPLKRALKYSFCGPELTGLVRFAQSEQPGPLLRMFDGEATRIKKDSKSGFPEQVKARDDILSEAKARKEEAKKEQAKEKDAAPAGPPKKKKKKAAAEAP
jgi:hypothetical protein